MKLFSKNIVFIVRDNQLGSYYLDLGFFLVPADTGVTMQTSDNFVSHKTFVTVNDMLDYMKVFENQEFNFSMAMDPLVSDEIMEKYFKDN